MVTVKLIQSAASSSSPNSLHNPLLIKYLPTTVSGSKWTCTCLPSALARCSPYAANWQSAQGERNSHVRKSYSTSDALGTFHCQPEKKGTNDSSLRIVGTTML